ncbi:hypothetical protein [Sphingomonas kyeonggiensis]|uniref:Uncharacterized protein n=1 Tax=Sphingomonas kyeonggiensis TaxID=1268553 RepID=A0A7W6NZ94_9SPHN|nr:hypothetical protein [Sphingomonas kyeonggiensis]MBB4100581.1 hypothetical protein [Sphingomonas kyeonggiensis]
MRLVALLALFALSTPAVAQQAEPDAAKPVEAKKKKSDDPNREICRRVASSSSRLGGRAECHTRAEWDAISNASNASVSRDLRGQ